MDKRILIIAPYQFGELSDCYYWAKYASIEGWFVTYIGYKSPKSRLKARVCPGVDVISVPHLSVRFLHGLLFYTVIIKTILLGRFNNIIVCSFPGVKVLGKLFHKRNIVLDIRTLSVSNDPNVRKVMDDRLRAILPFFQKVSAISEGVQKQLGYPSYLLPLGAEPLSNTVKAFKDIKLFYIGLFDNRNLDIFLEGLGMFQTKYGIPFTFDIVGGGSPDTEALLKDTVKKNNIKGVTFHGFLNHDECKPLFDSCNIGVCFVPITDYYNYQPPTKLFEYLLSGMACVATKTYANIEVINDDNGVLVEDNALAVCEGLFTLYSHLDKCNSIDIKENSEDYHWHKIVKNYFLPLFS